MFEATMQRFGELMEERAKTLPASASLHAYNIWVLLCASSINGLPVPLLSDGLMAYKIPIEPEIYSHYKSLIELIIRKLVYIHKLTP